MNVQAGSGSVQLVGNVIMPQNLIITSNALAENDSLGSIIKSGLLPKGML